MNCKKCGQEMEENTKVCSSCGFDMEAEQASQSDSVAVTKKSKRGSVIIISMTVVVVILVGFFLYILVFGGADRSRASRLCDLGDRYLSELDFEQAVASYQAAIELDPKAEDAYLGLAEAYIGQGNYEAAIEALERGIAESGSEMLTEYLAEVNAEYSQIEAVRVAEVEARQAEEEAAAKEAEANEYYETGRAYLYGLDGKEIDLESAYTNFEQAEELGKTEANFYLGLLCDWYSYPEKDCEMARAYYEKCEDDPYAQLALGFLYYYGQGVEEDKEWGKELFQAVIEQGCVEGYIGTAAVLRDEEEYEAALEDYIKASEGTEQVFIGTAMNMIGRLYDYGNGVEQDYAMAMEWYKKAADLGNTDAMSNIGWMYHHGNGVEQDYVLAMEWYKKAADLGHANAINNIGWLYQHGYGVEQDYEAAMEWYLKAAELGIANAMNNIGYMYQYGEGVEPDNEVAMEWYLKAAELGNANAMNNIGYMYKNGEGVEQDYEAAMEWYLKAAELGNASAMNNIGALYYYGYGVEEDYETALEWFEKAADLGNEYAKEWLEDIR